MLLHLDLLETKLFREITKSNRGSTFNSKLISYSLKIDQQKEVTKSNSITPILHENGDEDWDPSTI